MKVINYFGYLRPGGGPSGYLYNLNSAIEKNGSKKVIVLCDSIGDVRTVKNGAVQKYKLFASVFFLFKTILRQFRPMSVELRNKLKSFDSDDILVFHSVPDVTKYRATRKINNKYLLMIHSPKEPNLETFDLVKNTYGNNIFIRLAQRLVKHEEFNAIKNAHAINIPAEGAMDAYYREDERMRELLLSKKINKVVSGVPNVEPTVHKKIVRKELSLPENKRIVGYFGRYNEDKGYDRYLKYTDAFSKDDDLFFISAGAGSLKPVTTNRNYLDLGWRTDAINLINACDFILVPNKISYFDLIILEALSLGKEVITTNVGGAKGLVRDSVQYVNLSGDIENEIHELSVILRGEIRCSEEIKSIYNKNYSMDAFLLEYESLSIKLSKEILNED
ncbi:glycosyltransferase [Shewanella marisflavi]|uniref:glycosyltransferase n=1 Tax=Shewanella marisflavi TaxID=260364 RepID=UPI00200FA854|nr:glycosyltransferase [Shewanella marisflavi]MCL1040918.1 glycosyltransferase [Shewanella marisflavi]